ncbi:hypothetical protein Tco_0770752 [Tanacetum coccineum]|uniref:No apical meristem-associated C-terminal domain-containing protein n=1 Tax=Tanacetum coccineum TaxID=301880 RepID=A0ABQ4ZEF0_9ASTR
MTEEWKKRKKKRDPSKLKFKHQRHQKELHRSLSDIRGSEKEMQAQKDAKQQKDKLNLMALLAKDRYDAREERLQESTRQLNLIIIQQEKMQIRFLAEKDQQNKGAYTI